MIFNKPLQSECAETLKPGKHHESSMGMVKTEIQYIVAKIHHIQGVIFFPEKKVGFEKTLHYGQADAP